MKNNQQKKSEVRSLKLGRKAEKVLPKRTVVATILAVMGIDVLISYFFLLHQSLRLDESQSLWQASHSFTGVFQVVALDVHVPLYHTLLHFWILAFGNGIDTARILSLIFFLATIPMAYLMAKEVVSQRLALFSTILLGLSPFMNWYGNEIRMYTLLTLLAVISQYYFLRIYNQKPGRNWLGYTVAALVGAYSHYFFLFVLFTQGLFFLAQRTSFVVGTFKRLAGVAVAVVAILSPWLIYVHHLGNASGTRPMLAKPSTVDLFNTFSQFLFGFQSDTINTILVSFWPLTVLFVFLAIGKNRRLPASMVYMLVAGILPVFAAYLLSLTVTPIFVSRYLIIALPSLYIFMAWLFSNYTRRVLNVVAAGALITLTLTGIHQNVSASTPVREDYQQVAATVASEATPNDVVVLSTPFSTYPFDYYYNGSTVVKTLPDWDRGPIPAFDPKTLPAQVSALAQDHTYAYVVLSYDQGYEKTINNYFQGHFEQVSKHVYSDDLTLYVYRIGYKPAVQL